MSLPNIFSIWWISIDESHDRPKCLAGCDSTQTHYADSARVIDAVIGNFIEGVIPSHSVTKLDFITTKYLTREKANEMLQWLLQHFTVEPATQLTFRNALDSDFVDYEDAVVHTLASGANCDAIVTRNTKDFIHATIPVFTPTQFLEQFETLP